MRSIFLVFLIITCLFLATGWQSSGGRIGGLRVFNGAPTGTCASNQMAVDSTTGNFYSCKTGGWNQVTGGGGGSSNSVISMGAVSVPITNPKFPVAYSINTPAGDTDLYTVPANRKALVIEVVFTNPAGNSGSVSCDAEVKIAGVYHRFDFATLGATVGTYASINSVAPFLLAAGETFAVNTDHAGLTVWPYIVEFDSSVPIFDARLLSLNAGNNTLFTVPANKTISFIAFPSSFNYPLQGHVWYYNLSGTNRTVQINAVPSGGSPGVGNAIFNAAVTQRQMAQPILYGGLAPGDFLNVNTDANTATQMAWVIYVLQ